MKRFGLIAGAAALLALSMVPAMAQQPLDLASRNPSHPITAKSHTLTTPSYGGEAAMTVNTALPSVGIGIKATCTVAGNVNVHYFDLTTGVWVVTTGQNILPVIADEVLTTNTTATCTYTQLN